MLSIQTITNIKNQNQTFALQSKVIEKSILQNKQQQQTIERQIIFSFSFVEIRPKTILTMVAITETINTIILRYLMKRALKADKKALNLVYIDLCFHIGLVTYFSYVNIIKSN